MRTERRIGVPTTFQCATFRRRGFDLSASTQTCHPDARRGPGPHLQSHIWFGCGALGTLEARDGATSLPRSRRPTSRPRKGSIACAPRMFGNSFSRGCCCCWCRVAAAATPGRPIPSWPTPAGCRPWRRCISGNVPIGMLSRLTLLARNTGAAPLDITSQTIAADVTGSFSEPVALKSAIQIRGHLTRGGAVSTDPGWAAVGRARDRQRRRSRRQHDRDPRRHGRGSGADGGSHRGRLRRGSDRRRSRRPPAP